MLEVKHLRKEYKTKKGVVTKALDDVSLTFAETGMVFILGKSGSGKSTLLNVCGGLDKADSGEIIIKGKSSNDFSSQDFDSYRNTYVGFVFQEYNILEEFTVEENIALALELQNKKRDKDVIAKILEDVDMTNFAGRKPNTLSGGQKQRVAIARALVKEPEIIMADEPTGALDSKTGQQVFDTLKKLSETKLVIVISHDREFAEQYGDRIIELKDGKIISDQTRATEGDGAKNIRFFGTDTVCVQNGAAVTDEELQSIKRFLAKAGGSAVISTSREQITVMKQDRPEMSVGAFEDVREQPKSKAYPQQKLIRSHLPLRHAVRMGGSSLKTKPVRLAFTIFLSVIAFVLFGLASTLMLFDARSVTKETLTDVNDTHIIVSKAYWETYRSYNGDKLEYENESKNQTGYTFKEYEEIKKKYPGAVASVSADLSISSNVGITQAAQQFYSVYLDGVILTDSSLVYSNGKAPEKIDEIAVSDYILDMLMLPTTEFTYYKTVNKQEERVELKVTKAEDIIYSATNPVVLNIGGDKYKITGVYKGMEIPEAYADLKEAAKNNSPYSNDEDMWRWQQVRSAGMYAKLAVTEELVAKLAEKSSNNDYFDYGLYFQSSQAYVSVGVKDEDGNVNGTETGWLAKYESAEKPLLKLYDMKGNEVTSLSAGKVAMRYTSVASILFNIYNRNYWILENEVSGAMSDASYAAEEEYNKTHEYPNRDAYTDKDKYEADINKYQDARNAFAEKAYQDAFAKYTKENKEPKPEEFGDDPDAQNRYNEALNNYKNERIIYSENERNNAWNSYTVDNPQPEEYEYFNESAYSAAVKDYEKELESVKSEASLNASGKLKPLLLKEKAVKTAAYEAFDAENPEPTEKYSGEWYEWRNNRDMAAVMAWDKNNPFNALQSLVYGDIQPTRQEIIEIIGEANDMLKDMELLQGLVAVSHYDNSESSVEIAGMYFEGSRYDNGGMYLSSELYDKLYIAYSGNNWHSETETKYKAPADAYITALYIPNGGASTINELVDLTFVRNDDDSSIVINNSVMRSLDMVIGMVEMLSMIFMIAGIVLAVFAFLLMFNFISASISAKKKEIGILRAIGARTTDVFKIFLSESMIIALICFVLSTGITFALCIVLNGMLVDSAIQVSMFVFGPISILSIVAIALITALISTLIPVGLYSRKPPVASIRSL